MLNRYSRDLNFGEKRKDSKPVQEKKCDISCNCCHGINILNKIIFSHNIPKSIQEHYVLHVSPIKVNL